MSFTKGPWYADDFEIYSENDPANLLAHVYAVDRPEEPDGQWMAGDETRANMRIIKAAPELLEALELILRKYEAQADYAELDTDGAAVASARAAIAKARGES